MTPQFAVGTQQKVTHEGRTFDDRIQGAYLHFGAWRYTVVDMTPKNFVWRKLEAALGKRAYVPSPRGILVPESAFGKGKRKAKAA